MTTTLLPETQRRLRVTVLCGGPSAEREVSLESGRAVAEALRRRGHDVLVADIGPDQLSALDAAADVVFPALHGTFGEDGALQAIMEQRGIRFVGSRSAASALAMDKLAAKRVVEGLGLDTPPYWLVTQDDVERGGPPPFSAPVVIKPVDQGSSVDTLIVRDDAEVAPTVARIVRRRGRVLVERFITGDELTVGIVGRQTLPPICVRPKREFYDYQAKYVDETTEYLFDAGHPQELLERAGRQSWRVFEALGCRHLARVDWIADAAGRLWFLEVNTIPGFTSHSLVPKAAARVGVPFEELVDRLVRMAAEDSD
jgi:D-alanine-D-alanine ligase